MEQKTFFPKPVVDWFNGRLLAVRAAPRWGKAMRRRLTVVTYVGRRSGRTISTPVGFRRDGDTITIGVQMPDAKKWWRNFLGEGQLLTLELDGADRTGHAVAHRDDRGRVTVTVRLEFQP